MSTCAHTDVTAFHSLHHNFDKCHLLLLNLHVGILVGGGEQCLLPNWILSSQMVFYFALKKKKHIYGCLFTGWETEHLLSPTQQKQEQLVSVNGSF